MSEFDKQNRIFLQLELNKALQKDEFGNVIFEVEASNENLDVEEQKVLQSALLRSKEHFLKNGIVSKDHKFRTFNRDGSFDIHEEFIIGEPIDVYTKGNSTMVKGKLFPNNEYAKKFIDLLEQGSSRVKASVGGILPRIKKTIENGKNIGEIVSVLWDDLALTVVPVNPTVEPAMSMAKSLSSAEFVKALSAGYGTDAATFTGGRALQKEDVENEKVLVKVNDKAIESLVSAIASGDVDGEEEAESFLINQGISKSDACDIVQAVCKKSKNFIMEVNSMADEKKNGLWDEIKQSLRKSTSGKPEDEDDPVDTEADDLLDDDDAGEEYEDAGPIVKALTEKVEALEANIEIIAKAQAESLAMQKSLGKGMLALMERTEEVIASPTPRKGAVSQLEAMMLAKSQTGGGAAVSPNGRLKPFTPKTFDIAKDILIKAVGDGEIDTMTCAGYETQINKSMKNPNFIFTDDFVAFMRKHAE